ncbi:hypothetical protein [Streptomyces sp. YIM 98790]|uniref:hypothetical protein n=1 Tax=Streptomyces sp. YIM 98790 TaxID=2689077 RepID=UPI001409764C|nr:hypothetical protein [Streptomyces sp. YIM 98790]
MNLLTHQYLSAADPLRRLLDPHTANTGAVLACWPPLDEFTPPEQRQDWTGREWAEFLDGPTHEWPFSHGPGRSRRPIWHAQATLPGSAAVPGRWWWRRAGHRLPAAGPGGGSGNRWIAVHEAPGRVHLLVNLIDEHGGWADVPCPRLAAEARLFAGPPHAQIAPTRSPLPARRR